MIIDKLEIMNKIPFNRKKNLLLITLVFFVIFILFILMYFFVWRFSETTDDAYVNGHVITINSEVAGTVKNIFVEDTDLVKAGTVLLTLDDNDAILAFNNSQDNLKQVIRKYWQLKASVAELKSLVAAKKTALNKAKDDYNRRSSLVKQNIISKEEFKHVKALVDSAQADLNATIASYDSAKSALGKDDSLENQPNVLTAINQLKKAWLDLQRTKILSPITGQIAKRNVQVGQKLNPGAPLMAIIDMNKLWVDANFKENQTRNIRIGQNVEMEADIYGSKIKYHGKVIGVSAGTGSVFSLLPPQNATGNWIKVTQRIPVRISIDEKDLKKSPLIIGVSMKVKVMLKNSFGKMVNTTQFSRPNVSQNEVQFNFKEVEDLISSIISENKDNNSWVE